jgi:hypothetical protein
VVERPNLFHHQAVRQVLDTMVQPAQSSSPENSDRPFKRLSSDESLWGRAPEREPAPAEEAGPSPSNPAGRRPLWRRALRVDLLLAGAAAALLAVGFVLGMAVTGPGSPPPATSQPSVPATASAAATVTSIVVQPGPPPRSCRSAVEWADKAIAYMVGNIRDDRLSTAIQKFVESRRACQRAVR